MANSDARRVGGDAYRSLGTMPDGVVILAPKLAPTHFKAGQIRATIARLGRTSGGGESRPKTVKQPGRPSKP